MRTVLIALTCGAALSAAAQQKWTLQQCLQRAEEKNLSVRDAALDAELAGAAHDQAYWSFLPDLNAAATHGYNYGRVVDRFTNTFATDRVRTNNFYLSSDLTLYQGGRKRSELAQADLNEQAAGKGLEASKNAVRTEVVRSFLNVLGLRERIASAEAQVAISRAQVERTQALVDAGRVARADLLDVQAQLASDEYTVIDLRNQHDQALLQLGQYLLLEPAQQASFDIEAPAVTELVPTEPSATEDQVLSNVLATNPAFAQADLNAQSAERSMTIARSGALPSLLFNASAGTGYSGRNLEPVGSPFYGTQTIGYTEGGEAVLAPTVSYDTRTRPFSKQLDDNLNESISFTLSVPIFNNKRNSYAVDQARIRHEQALDRLENERLSLQRDVQNALTAQRAAYRQYESARRSVEASEESLRYATERHAQGTITALELNTAQSRAQRATADLINAKYSYLMAQKSLDILQGIMPTL